MRRAFTLPEVLVAILVLAVGILGLTASGAYIATQAGDARAMTEGAVLAGRALDSLRALPCGSLASGSLTSRGSIMRWTASPGSRTVALSATLELFTRRGPRLVPIQALVPCDR